LGFDWSKKKKKRGKRDKSISLTLLFTFKEDHINEGGYSQSRLAQEDKDQWLLGPAGPLRDSL
jgi:hypothetical protein